MQAARDTSLANAHASPEGAAAAPRRPHVWLLLHENDEAAPWARMAWKTKGKKKRRETKTYDSDESMVVVVVAVPRITPASPLWKKASGKGEVDTTRRRTRWNQARSPNPTDEGVRQTAVPTREEVHHHHHLVTRLPPVAVRRHHHGPWDARTRPRPHSRSQERRVPPTPSQAVLRLPSWKDEGRWKRRVVVVVQGRWGWWKAPSRPQCLSHDV